MKFAYFPGCKIDFYLKDYGVSFKSIMKKLSVELVELPFNCCGYPARSHDFKISIFSSIRNFAIARKFNLDIVTPCMCCYGQLKYASLQWKLLEKQPGNSIKKQTSELKHYFNTILAKENLFWDGRTEITHLLSFLHDDIGINAIKKKIKRKLPKKRVVTQYGCHALRPFTVTGFDNPHAPRIFEELINITGLKSVEWSKSTECCGNPIYGTSQKLSLKLLYSKLDEAIKVKTDYICTACTHCQIQYSDLSFQKKCATHKITPMLFTRMLDTVL